jgi:hypothetical protein
VELRGKGHVELHDAGRGRTCPVEERILLDPIIAFDLGRPQLVTRGISFAGGIVVEHVYTRASVEERRL